MTIAKSYSEVIKILKRRGYTSGGMHSTCKTRYWYKKYSNDTNYQLVVKVWNESINGKHLRSCSLEFYVVGKDGHSSEIATYGIPFDEIEDVIVKYPDKMYEAAMALGGHPKIYNQGT